MVIVNRREIGEEKGRRNIRGIFKCHCDVKAGSSQVQSWKEALIKSTFVTSCSYEVNNITLNCYN